MKTIKTIKNTQDASDIDLAKALQSGGYSIFNTVRNHPRGNNRSVLLNAIKADLDAIFNELINRK